VKLSPFAHPPGGGQAIQNASSVDIRWFFIPLPPDIFDPMDVLPVIHYKASS